MTGRLNPVLAMAAAALLAAPSLSRSASADAQDMSRYSVLIPDFYSVDGNDRRFGQRVAEELQRLMNGLPTHSAIERRQINNDLNRFRMKMEELDCIRTRQLGAQMNARMAICASIESEGDSRHIKAIEVWDLYNQESFSIADVSADRNGHREAAQEIFDAFDVFNQQLRSSIICSEYAASQLWEEALRSCDEALELNPTALGTLYQKAEILRALNRYDESLAALETVLEAEPYREDALQLGGWLATQLQQNEKGREFYGRYLELNPGDVAVRRNIAYEIYEAGDAEGAMLFIEEGLAIEEDVELLQDFGNYAFQAAARASQAAQADNGPALNPQVAGFYAKAIEAYMKVFEQKGAEMDVAQMRNVVNAHLQLEQVDEALRVAEQVLQTHPEEPALLAAYASGLQRSGRLDDALAAWKRIEAIDPNFPDLYLRQGQMLLTARRFGEALPYLKQSVERGRDPNQVARMILAEAHGNGIRADNWDYAIPLLEAVRSEFQVSQDQREEFAFWLGFTIYNKAMKDQEPNTPQSARATLPAFQRAKRLFEEARPYGQRSPGSNLAQFLSATDQYIEIQEALIRRGGGGG